MRPQEEIWKIIQISGPSSGMPSNRGHIALETQEETTLSSVLIVIVVIAFSKTMAVVVVATVLTNKRHASWRTCCKTGDVDSH